MYSWLKFILSGILYAFLVLAACDDGGIIPGFKVTYHGNGNTGGTVPVDSNIYDEGETVSVLGNSGNLVKYGSFIGWNTDAAGTGTTYTAGQTFKIGTENVDLYAKWSSSDYKLRNTGPAGGIIFYDKGIYSDGWRFLEAAPYSSSPLTDWQSKQWGSYGTVIIGTETGLGTGKANTALIVTWLKNNTDNSNGDVTYKTDRAAYLCDALIFNGYSDWFLPSKDELDKMYINLKSGTDENGVSYSPLSGFITDNYWSSSENSSTDAWSQDFSDGAQTASPENSIYRVRAIRAF